MRTGHAVELHIEELILQGFVPAERARIGEALERELARLLAEEGLPGTVSRAGEISHMNGGTVTVLPGGKAEAVGAKVARAVYEGMSQLSRRGQS
jgi:hypothetical protein